LKQGRLLDKTSSSSPPKHVKANTGCSCGCKSHRHGSRDSGNRGGGSNINCNEHKLHFMASANIPSRLVDSANSMTENDDIKPIVQREISLNLDFLHEK